MHKKIIFFFAVILLYGSPAFTQSKSPLKKLYAYKQLSVSGVKSNLPVDAAPDKTATYNYWFYLLFPKSEEITVTEIWLSGKKFSPKTESISQLPVTKINYTDPSSQSSPKVLVPFTTNAVLLTYPAMAIPEPGTLSRYFTHLINHHELVITYFWKGHKFYKVARRIKELDPEVRM